MRVLMLTNLYPNPLQPHRANHVRQQFRLVAEQHDVMVISPVAWTVELAARHRGQRLPPERRAKFDGVPIDYPRYWFTPKVLRGWYGRFFRWSVRDAFQRALADFRPELVYAPWAYPDGWAAVQLGHRAGLPVVLKVVGSDVLLLSKYPRRERGTLEALRQADAVIAVSRDLAERLTDYGIDPRKVHVVYDGVDPTLFHPGPRAEARSRIDLPGNEPLLLFVGNLVPVKGLDILIEACGRLADRGAAFTCLLVGQGPLQPQIERQARRRGLEGRVRFMGSVPNDRLPDWYRAASVVVLSSHSEGVPNVLLEAAACGTPFVASRVGGIPEIAHLGPSRLVPPGDPGLLAEAVAAFFAGEAAQSVNSTVSVRSRAESAVALIGVFEQILVSHREGTSTLQPARRRDHVVSSINC
jgi:glycosyltransferase involved in cell wall biosynthesis